MTKPWVNPIHAARAKHKKKYCGKYFKGTYGINKKGCKKDELCIYADQGSGGEWCWTKKKIHKKDNKKEYKKGKNGKKFKKNFIETNKNWKKIKKKQNNKQKKKKQNKNKQNKKKKFFTVTETNFKSS